MDVVKKKRGRPPLSEEVKAARKAAKEATKKPRGRPKKIKEPEKKMPPPKPSRDTQDYQAAIRRHLELTRPPPPIVPAAKPVAKPAAPAAKPAPVAKPAPKPRKKKEEGSAAERKIAREFEEKEARRIAERDKGMSELDKEIRDQELFVKSLRSDMVKRAINVEGIDEDDKKAIEEAIKKMSGYKTYQSALKDLEDMMKEKRSKK